MSRAALLAMAAVAGAALAAGARLEFLHTPADRASKGEAYKVDGSLSGDARQLDRLMLHYRSTGEDYAEARMELQYGDLFRGVIAAAHVQGAAIEYFVEAVMQSGEKVPVLGSAKRPIRVSLGAEGEAEASDARTKGKKKKKGKSDDEPVVVRPIDEPPTEEPAAKSEPPPERPARTEPPPRQEARTEPKPEPRPEARPAPDTKSARAEPPRKRSDLEDELAIYTAEDTSGMVTHVADTARAPVPTTILELDELKQRGVRTVADALDLVSGLTVSRDIQGFYRVGVRGLRNDGEVLFTIDGHPLNPLYDARALWNLPVANLERLEVTRGPGIELGAFLAKINLVTNRQDGLRALASAGLFQSYEGHLAAAHHFGPVQLHVDGDVVSQHGQSKLVTKDSLDTNTIAQGKRQSGDPAGTINDQRLLVNVGGGVDYRSDTVGTLTLGGRFILESRGALIGEFDTLGPDSHLNSSSLLVDLGYARKVGTGTISVRAWFDQHSTVRQFQLSPTDYQVKTGQPNFPEGLRDQLSVGNRSFGGAVDGDFALPAKNRFTAAVSGSFAALSGFDLLTNFDPATTTYVGPSLQRPAGVVYPTEAGGGAAARRIAVGLFAKDTWAPVEKFSIELGFKLDLVTVPTGTTGGPVTGSRMAVGLGPRAGLVFSPIDSLALKASYARGFRPGTVQEYADTIPNSDSNQGRPVGNPALVAPTLDAVELGFEYAQLVGDARVTLTGAAFFENVSNPIVVVDPSGNLFPYSNRPQGVRVLGAEGSAKIELSRRSAAWVNASFFRAEDLGTVPTARLLTDTPQARFNAGLSVPLGPYLAADVTVRVGAERQSNARSVLELIRRYQLPGYAVVGAQLRTEPLFDHLELGLLIQNAFNFQIADDVPRPDRVTPGVPREGATGFLYARVEL